MLSTDAHAEDRATGSPHAPPVAFDAQDDRERLHAMAEANYDFVWRTLRRLGLTESAADDATQQVFVVAGKRLASIELGREKAFLYRAAALLAMESRRRDRRERSDEEAVLGLPDAAPGPEELLSRSEARAMLDLLLAALPDESREVLVLFELEGLSIPEIAALLDVPAGTCASRLRRAREEVREAAKRQQAKRSRKTPRKEGA